MAGSPRHRVPPSSARWGGLERYKGHHRLIVAMPALLTAAPGAHLAVVGRGAYERQLRRLAAQPRCRPCRDIHEFRLERIGRDWVRSSARAMWSRSSATTRRTRSPCLQARALGRKVVVAATSGLTELAEKGAVTTVPLDAQPAVLAAVLVRVADGPDAPAPKLRTWDDCAHDLLRVYGQAAEAGS